jgi:RNA ligase (TIGR02306 family)
MIELKSLEEALEYKAPPQAQIAIISEVLPTPNSDRLHSFTMKGMDWTVISSNIEQTEESFGLPRYEGGAKVIYIAIDSILKPELEAHLFPEGSKISLEKGRVRTLKLRGAYSQGMIVDINDELEALYPGISNFKVGDDVAGALGIVKYEPPASAMPAAMKAKEARKNPAFHEFCDIKNIKWFTEAEVFEPGELVYVTSKLHGSSIRAGILPTHVPPLTFKFGWKEFFIVLKKHILKRLGLLPKFEYCVGTRRTQLQDKPKDHKTYYENEGAKNMYQTVSDTFKLESKLKPGEILFGEVVGQGVQEDYDYGFKEGSKLGRYGFFAYDVMVNGRYLPAQEFLDWCKDREVAPVPFLGFIPYDLDVIKELASAKKCLNGQKIREGVVVKGLDEKAHPACGRRVFKVISPEYLMKDNTDWH